mmetsp:Transcript_140322/g.356053  ORF Transcript_140322/g.356053 Transcript_140322/m.356053 type:complete len:179 (-) Transcript_140322:74-610(-)
MRCKARSAVKIALACSLAANFHGILFVPVPATKSRLALKSESSIVQAVAHGIGVQQVDNGHALVKALTVGASVGLACALLLGDVALAVGSTQLSKEDRDFGMMVFGFNIRACKKLKPGAEPLCDDIIAWSENKPTAQTTDRLARWNAARSGDTVTAKLDDACMKALAKLVDAGPDPIP